MTSDDGHFPMWTITHEIGCECGWRPKNRAKRMSTQHVAHQTHRRQLKLVPVEYYWPDDAYGVAGAVSVGRPVVVRGHSWDKVSGGWVPRT